MTGDQQANQMTLGERVGCLAADTPFFGTNPTGGDDVASQCQANFAAAVSRLTALGGKQVTIDFSPLLEIAAMLYTASFVAERYSGIREFLESPLEQDPPAELSAGPAKAAAALHYMSRVESDERLLPVTRAIICGSGECLPISRALYEYPLRFGVCPSSTAEFALIPSCFVALLEAVFPAAVGCW